MFVRVVRRSRSILLSIALLVCMSWTGWNAEAQEIKEVNLVTNGDFEQGIAGWKTYRKKDPKSSLSQSSENAYSGLHSLKVETPGAGTLEGPNITVKVTPRNTYLISTYAKGQGKVMLSLYGSGGYTYGSKTNLSSEWQELKVRRFEKSGSFSLHVITCSEKNQKVTFYVDNVKVIKEKISRMSSVEVEPLWYEAEDYKGNAKIVKDNSVSGGAYAEGVLYYNMASEISFPQTAKPVYIYLKVFSIDNSKSFLTVFHGRERTSSRKPSVSNEWTWVKNGPFTAREIGKEFWIRADGAPKIKIKLDAIVVTTNGSLTEKELEYIKGYDL